MTRPESVNGHMAQLVFFMARLEFHPAAQFVHHRGAERVVAGGCSQVIGPRCAARSL